MMVKEQMGQVPVKSTGEMRTLKFEETYLVLRDWKKESQGLEVSMFVALEQQIKNNLFLTQFL